jgi:hypothetical protein
VTVVAILRAKFFKFCFQNLQENLSINVRKLNPAINSKEILILMKDNNLLPNPNRFQE